MTSSSEAIGIDGYPLALHYVMFIPSLVGQVDQSSGDTVSHNFPSRPTMISQQK